LYLTLLNSGIKLSAEEVAKASVRLSNVFKVGNVYEGAKQVDQYKVQVVSDKGLSVLNQDKTKPLKDLKISILDG
jgi:hypothetical protein